VEEVEIDDNNKFKVGNVRFSIQEDSELKIEGIDLGDGEVIDAVFDESMFSTRIDSNGMFKMEGVWYVLEKNSNGEYVRAKFSKIDDNVLTYFDVVDDDDKGQVGDLTFAFIYSSDGTTQVQITQDKKVDVIDTITEERCAFDGEDIIITADKPFDFQLSKIVFDNSDLPDE
jgi:hypothetical protein